MSFPPPGRWFQFSLGTWFVLVAIVAWAMLQRPYVLTVWKPLPTPPAPVILATSHPSGLVFTGTFTNQISVRTRRPNPALLYPALALAAFVGWKAAWALFIRWRDKPVHPYLN